MKIHDANDTQPCAWRQRLDEFVAARMLEPFAWATNDCCIYAADAVLAMEGVDLAADVRGTYEGPEQALRVLDELGGLEAVGSRAGVEIPPLSAGPGDIGIVTSGGRQLLGVCVGPVWLAPAATGTAAIPLRDASRAWRVQHG